MKILKILEKKHKERKIIPLSKFPSPTLLPNLVRGAKRIVEALLSGKRVLIVGDYDCDGVCATTIIVDVLRALGFGHSVDYIVPDRFVDGYGVSKNMVNYAISNLFDIIITVDNGIGAKEAVAYATESGIEVIITDHHTPGDAIPEVDIIINPKYALGDFPFKEISGATVAWLLAAQINTELNGGLDMRKWLDLVGITVVSDVMPLHSINVSLVKFALEAIKSEKRYVYSLAFDANKRATLTETDIGFGFVPMINAVGRIDHAKHAVNMLLSKDKTFVKKTFTYVQEVNNRRKALNEELMAQIMPSAETQAYENVIIVRQDELHEGIVGILAGRLAEKFQRPAYVFSWNRAKQCWKGSARTSGVVNLYNLTNVAKDFVIGFGGHAGAAGVAVSEAMFDDFELTIRRAADELEIESFKPVGEKPILLDIGDLTAEFVEKLQSFRPYGEGFPAPVFKTSVFLSVMDSYKNGLHWKTLLFDAQGNSRKAWFFHEKRVGEFSNNEVEIKYFPQYTKGNDGIEIELHASIL